ncbi:MAG: FMN-binding negative transcriptional regulator [Pseudomonadota bacterium]
MHPNQAFRKETKEQNLAFVRGRGFGILTINADNGPLVSHIPIVVSEDGSDLEMHLVRSNPILRLLREPRMAVVAVSGGDAYISPDWYQVPDQVPTWNYVAVHLRGELSLLEHKELHGVLERLSEHMETRLLPKKPWTSEKMTAEVYEKMLRQIVPVKMQISEISGTWKLSQNKTEDVRLAAADGLANHGFGSEVEDVVKLMRHHVTE